MKKQDHETVVPLAPTSGQMDGPWWRPVFGLNTPAATYRCPCGGTSVFRSDAIVDSRVSSDFMCPSCLTPGPIVIFGWDKLQWMLVEFVGGGSRDGEVEAHLAPRGLDSPTTAPDWISLPDGSSYRLEVLKSVAVFRFVPRGAP